MVATIVFVPGLRDESDAHWQSWLAARLPGSVSVPALGRDRLSAADRVDLLGGTLSRIDGPVVLVAHSGGCITVAQWALNATRPVARAFLATPADLERPLPAGYPSMPDLDANGWLPVPRRPLGFSCVVGISDDDPLGEPSRVRELAASWGAVCVNLGAVGHLNPAAGFGAWPQGETLLRRLVLEPTAARPTASRAAVAGSGTGVA